MYDVRGNIMSSKYKRVLLKLSGEAIAKKDSHEIFDNEKIAEIATVVKKLTDDGVQVVVDDGSERVGGVAHNVAVNRAHFHCLLILDDNILQQVGILRIALEDILAHQALHDQRVAFERRVEVNQ